MDHLYVPTPGLIPVRRGSNHYGLLGLLGAMY